MPTVNPLLKDTDPFVRAHALLALEAIGNRVSWWSHYRFERSFLKKISSYISKA